jgi:hypothetical protein
MIGGNAPDNSDDVIIGFWVEIRSEKLLWLPGPKRGRLLAEKGRENKSVNKMAFSRFVRNANMTQKYRNYRLKTTTNTYKNINKGFQSSS